MQNPFSSKGPTKRVVFINMTNNLDCLTPKITFKRDDELGRDEVSVSVEDFPEEFALRNLGGLNESIHIRYEFRSCWNYVLIDTPGLKSPGDEGQEEREEMIMEIAKPKDRTLFFIEECGEWDEMQMSQFAEKVDPNMRRTNFVFTKFQFQLSSFTTARELNMWLSGRPSSKVRSFFVSLFSSTVHENFREPGEFKLKVEQSTKRDFDTLDRLKYDKG